MLALSLQLEATAKAVAFVMAGRSLSDVLADGSVVKPQLRAGVQALSFAALRHYGMASTLRSLLADRAPPPAVDALLCTALALAVCGVAGVEEPGAESGVSYTDFTLVNQAVEAAKANPKTRTSSSFINALLRRFLRERESLMEAAMQSDVARYNHPQWWIDLLSAEQPERWEQILLANQMRPPLTLRINALKSTRDDYAALLAAQGLACKPPPSQSKLDMASSASTALVLEQSVPVMRLPLFDEGGFSVQDAAAQGAARQLLSPEFLDSLMTKAKAGHKIRVLDACAAPGGKTTHLMELLTAAFDAAGMPSQTKDGVAFEAMPFQVVALEVDAKRAKRIHDNLARLKLRATVKVADAGQLASWWDGAAFDAILIDAPCTASGIVRRHPDVRWLRRAADVQQASSQQSRLLQALWPALRTCGRLLYATCSVFQLEGAIVTQRFLTVTADANGLDSHGLWLPSALNDGFYDALFEKTSR